MATKVTLPTLRTPLINEDGTVNREWYQFFLDMYNRVGGNDSQSDAISDADGTLADATRAINAVIAALESYTVIDS